MLISDNDQIIYELGIELLDWITIKFNYFGWERLGGREGFGGG